MGSLVTLEKVGASTQERLGGARADFVAMLGRRIAELGTTLRGLEVDPGSVRLRDDMRRRLHALAAGAKLLRFTRLADEVTQGERVLEAAAQRMTPLTPDELIDLKALLDCAPALAWGQASVEPTPTPTGVTTKVPESGRAPAVHAPSIEIPPAVDAEIVLVVGPSSLADALTQGIGEPLDSSAPRFEAERTDDCATAIDLARALAPDMAIVDVDRPGAKELVAALLSDPLTEPVPVIVVGDFPRPEDAAPFVALGVARALAKPVSPRALSRAASEVLATYVRREIKRKPIGPVTLDDLGARLSEELYRGLCDAADKGRGARFDLGEGNEVLAALWGAVARIRDLVTIQSQGDVRFSASGPEGALPLAPFSGGDAEPRTEGRTSAASRAAAPSLKGKTIVVADDDPAVIWFLAGVLRAAGAEVFEAHDGARALDLCFQHAPDLLITDVIMPKLDGFAVCRALKRDLVLRDVPTILLSWKEDLLQRVRELGADADGYLRKEAAASTIIQRARELLRGRHRVAERLAAGGEVRGRLDGMTARTLLRLACESRPNATIAVRDASFLYEIEIRNGRPVRATRTSTDGTFVRGPSVLGAMLGVGAGRFVVTPLVGAQEGRTELDGTLDEQLLGHIASARAAQRLLSGTSLVRVEQVDLDPARMEAYLGATPEPARSILYRLAGGASPRSLIHDGEVAPRLLEDVLCDAAAHGAISGVTGPGEEELLFTAIEHELRVLRGVKPPPAPLPEPVLDLGPVIGTSAPGPVEPVASELPPATREESPEPAFSLVQVNERPSVVPEEEPVVSVSVAPRAPAPPIVIVQPAAPALVARAAEPVVIEPEPELARPTLGSLTPPPIPPPQKVVRRAPVREEPEPSPTPMRTAQIKRPSSYAPSPTVDSTPPKKDTSNRTMWMLFAVAGIIFAVGARLAREHDSAPPQAAAPAPQETVVAPVATSEPAASEGRGDGETKADPILPQDAALKDSDKVPPGQGLLEVVAGANDAVWIDGTAVGNGPIVRRALAPRRDPYEVRVKLRGEDRVRFILVKEGRLSRLRVAPPWSR